jgi:hypothetical protein
MPFFHHRMQPQGTLFQALGHIKVTTSIDLISWLSNAKHTFIYTYTPKSLTPFIKEKKEKKCQAETMLNGTMDG